MAMSEFVGQHGPNNNVYYADAIPTAGTFKKGDIIWNTNAAAGEAAFWYCTTAGSTGTFVLKAVATAG